VDRHCSASAHSAAAIYYDADVSRDLGSLNPQMLALGLILEKPDTMVGVQARLGNEFEEVRIALRRARWAGR
jgi:hypothetical protein